MSNYTDFTNYMDLFNLMCLIINAISDLTFNVMYFVSQNQPMEGEDPSDYSFRHITEITILTVQLIVEFSKRLPGFNELLREDQITLLKACSSEVMMLRMARKYDVVSDSIIFANNQPYTRDSYNVAGMGETIEDLLRFCRQMFAMKVNNAEYALLTAIVIFSGPYIFYIILYIAIK